MTTEKPEPHPEEAARRREGTYRILAKRWCPHKELCADGEQCQCGQDQIVRELRAIFDSELERETAGLRGELEWVTTNYNAACRVASDWKTKCESARVELAASKAEADRLRDEIDEWQMASGLTGAGLAGDPGSVRPADLAKDIAERSAEEDRLRDENTDLRRKLHLGNPRWREDYCEKCNRYRTEAGPDGIYASTCGCAEDAERDRLRERVAQLEEAMNPQDVQELGEPKP